MYANISDVNKRDIALMFESRHAIREDDLLSEQRRRLILVHDRFLGLPSSFTDLSGYRFTSIISGIVSS